MLAFEDRFMSQDVVDVNEMWTEFKTGPVKCSKKVYPI